MLIFSLSSIPSRFDQLGETLACLLAQSSAADRILLHIPDRYDRFPDWDGTLPDMPAGVEIRRCRADYGPATKLLGTLEEYPTGKVDILICDDDRAYPRDWAACLLAAHKTHPDCAICTLGLEAHLLAGGDETRANLPRAGRRWRITDLSFQTRLFLRRFRHGKQAQEPGRKVFQHSGFVDIFEGCGGVYLRPDMFDETAFDIPQIARSVDDIWLSGMLARAGVPIWLTANRREPEHTSAQAFDPLVENVENGMDRAAKNRAAIDHLRQVYGLWNGAKSAAVKSINS